MKEYANKPRNVSRTLESSSKVSRQAPVSEILQTYKDRAIWSPFVQNEVSVGDGAVSQFRPRNPQDSVEVSDIGTEYTNLLNKKYTDPVLRMCGHLTNEEFANGLLQSANKIFWYGATPKTDEQVEIMASANYLHLQKQDWQSELRKRERHIAPVKPAWEKYQEEVGKQTGGEPIGEPWFLNPRYGYHISDLVNIAFCDSSKRELAHPDQNDPQQILGRTYDRDTSFSIDSHFAGGQTKMLSNASVYADFASASGKILRLFKGADMDSASRELRVDISTVDRSHSGFQIIGTVMKTPQFYNGGYTTGELLTITKTNTNIAVTINSVNTGSSSTIYSWCAQLVEPVYYNAVILAEDGLGMRFQTDGAKGRNRGIGYGLDDTTMRRIGGQYDPDDDLSYANTLGPYRNRINIQDLNWDISVARYRRLGGDSIFTEANHTLRDLDQYSNLIQPAAGVNVRDPDWYYNSQKHNPGRFVGGRSNSTLLYLKTASILYQQGHLSLKECLDVMAFVIADMVVSGEHSMPECMTSVVRAAQYSPPWNTTELNISAPEQILSVWLHLIDSGVINRMRIKTFRSLVNVLPESIYESSLHRLDITIVKVLTALDKQLYNYIHV